MLVRVTDLKDGGASSVVLNPQLIVVVTDATLKTENDCVWVVMVNKYHYLVSMADYAKLLAETMRGGK